VTVMNAWQGVYKYNAYLYYSAKEFGLLTGIYNILKKKPK